MEQIAEKSWQIANRLPAMADAAREVFDWLAGQPLPSRVKYSVGLAIEELATNMIKYGYDDDAEHLIRFTISVHPDHLKIVFEDDGHPFDPTRYPPPRCRTHRPLLRASAVSASNSSAASPPDDRL
jgi:anti-sigma regulatory factor (Ser/Thr protein kinase)